MPAGAKAASTVATMAQGVTRDAGFAALLSVGLTTSSSVATGAVFTTQAGEDLAALRVTPALACAPSIWAAEASAPKVRHHARRKLRCGRRWLTLPLR